MNENTNWFLCPVFECLHVWGAECVYSTSKEGLKTEKGNVFQVILKSILCPFRVSFVFSERRADDHLLKELIRNSLSRQVFKPLHGLSPLDSSATKRLISHYSVWPLSSEMLLNEPKIVQMAKRPKNRRFTHTALLCPTAVFVTSVSIVSNPFRNRSDSAAPSHVSHFWA